MYYFLICFRYKVIFCEYIFYGSLWINYFLRSYEKRGKNTNLNSVSFFVRLTVESIKFLSAHFKDSVTFL